METKGFMPWGFLDGDEVRPVRDVSTRQIQYWTSGGVQASISAQNWLAFNPGVLSIH